MNENVKTKIEIVQRRATIKNMTVFQMKNRKQSK